MPIARHSHYERHFGNVPPAQLGLSPAVDRVLTDPGGDVNAVWIDPPWATETELADAVVDAYAAIGFIDLANAACQAIADWTSDGGTPTVQAAAGGSYGLPRATPGGNSIRIRTAATPDGAYAAADTLFPYKAGRHYAAFVAVKVIDDPGTGNVFKWLVSWPSSDQTFLSFGDTAAPINQWRYLVNHWTAPTDAPVGGIGLTFSRDAGDVGGTADLYVGYQQIVELPSPEASLTELAINDYTQLALSPTGWRMHSQSENGRLGVGDGNAFISGGGNTAGVDASTGLVYHFVEHTPGDLAELGHEFDVGDDYVPVYLSEKDATTAQLYAGSGFVLELAGDFVIDCGGAP